MSISRPIPPQGDISRHIQLCVLLREIRTVCHFAKVEIGRATQAQPVSRMVTPPRLIPLENKNFWKNIALFVRAEVNVVKN
jgi:hypothetical protein